MGMMTAFHFLRPLWLLALLPLAGLLWVMWRRRFVSRSWQRVVDARLLPHLLIGNSVGSSATRGKWILFAIGLGGALASLALAGPTWHQLAQPVFRQQSALVVVLDLSQSMDAGDIKPSRLQRAQLKLRDILGQQKEGDTALIVYAATPFVVTPLTTDANTIATQVDSLTTDLMPAQGARPDLAINLAQKLLSQAGALHGGVLLITDGVGDTEPSLLKAAVQQLTAAGHRLSVLGVGTPQGAPISAPDGGFVKSDSGAIVLPKLDDAALAALAQQGHGVYRRLSTDDSDFHALLAPFEGRAEQSAAKEVNGLLADQWRDEGPWLLLPLIPLAALFFRRGYLLIFFLFVLPQTHSAYAADWSSLWQRDDQRGQQAMAAQQPQRAATLFQNPEWRAAANYRSGNYQAALDNLKGVIGAEAHYNRGNALAKLGRLPEAINAYDEALKGNPHLDDARYNRELLEKMMKKQQQEQSAQVDKQADKQKDKQEDKQNDKQGDKQGEKQNEKQDGKQSDKQKDKQNDQQQQSDKQQGGGKQQQTPRQQGNADEKQQQQPSAQKPGQQKDTAQGPGAEAAEPPKEMRQADEQWLRRIPDDPGGLWRRKFLYQYNRQQQRQGNEK